MRVKVQTAIALALAHVQTASALALAHCHMPSPRCVWVCLENCPLGVGWNPASGCHARARAWPHPPIPHPFQPKTRPRWLKTLSVRCVWLSCSLACFHTLWNRFLVDFQPQLGSQNPPKFNQKSILGHTLSWLLFLIDFWLIFPPNFHHPEPQKSSFFISF